LSSNILKNLNYSAHAFRGIKKINCHRKNKLKKVNNDNQLIEQINKGNKQIFNDLFREYYQKLCAFAFKFVKTKDVSEEIVQDIFVHLWENSDTIQIQLSLKSYLYSAVRNKSLNFLKHEKFETEFAESTIYEEYYEIDENQENTELIVKLKKAILNLPEKCQEIFVLSKNEGLTYDEIADYLKVSQKTVENQMGIAFKKLRADLICFILLVNQFLLNL